MEGRLQAVRRALVLGFALLLALPALASAHSLVRLEDGGRTLAYISVDEVSRNTVTITRSGLGTYDLEDPTVVNGMDPGSCTPISETHVRCTAPLLNKIHIEVGEHDDDVKLVNMTAGVKGEILLGPGNDSATGGAGGDDIEGEKGNDTIHGGGGDDVILGGLGEDQILGEDGNDNVSGNSGTDGIDGGNGNDQINSRDNIADTVKCGIGVDTVTADFQDQFAPSELLACETVNRASGSVEGGGNDTTPPKLAVCGESQRVSTSRPVTSRMATSEVALITADCVIKIKGGRTIHLKRQLRQVTKPGGHTDVEFPIGKKNMKRLKDAKKKHRKITATVTATAKDNAANTSEPVSRSFRVRV
jgi:hypothetical protein